MNRKKDKSQLTEVELELMSIVWEIGECSVSDVIREVAKQRKMAYTSAATILGILEQKKFLGSRKEGKSRLYTALVPRHEYESRSINRMVKKMFDDKPLAMVSRLIEEETLSREELRAMKKILDERLNNG